MKDRLLTFSYRIESDPQTNKQRIRYLDMYAGESWTDFVNRIKNQDMDGDQSSTEHTFQLDYTTPFAKHHTFETGAKYILRDNKSTNDKYDAATDGNGELAYDKDNSRTSSTATTSLLHIWATVYRLRNGQQGSDCAMNTPYRM